MSGGSTVPSDASTFSVYYYDKRGRLLYKSAVPASPGDASLSFLGIVFNDARIARVAIKTPGDTSSRAPMTTGSDAVVMDDFIFGEPRLVR